MTSFKKIFAAATAAATVGVLSLASMTASAEEIPPVENAPYTVYMSVQAGAEQAWAPAQGANVSVPGDGTYTLEYTFTLGSATIEALILDSDINAYSFAPEDTADPIADSTVTMKVDSINLKKADGSTAAITYNGPSEGAFRCGDNGTCLRYNVLNQWTAGTKVYDIAAELPGDGAGEGDVLSVTFTITGLDNGGGGGEGEGGTTTTTTTTTTDAGGNGGTTTTTTTKAQSSGGVVNNNNSVATTKAVSNSTTGTVSQTADAGVVAIVVGAAAAASLAVGAMTIKRKRK